MIISRDRWICIVCFSQSDAWCKMKTVTSEWNSTIRRFDWCFCIRPKFTLCQLFRYSLLDRSRREIPQRRSVRDSSFGFGRSHFISWTWWYVALFCSLYVARIWNFQELRLRAEIIEIQNGWYPMVSSIVEVYLFMTRKRKVRIQYFFSQLCIRIGSSFSDVWLIKI